VPTGLLRDMENLIEPAFILEIQPALHPTPRNKGLNTNSQLTALFYTVAFTADLREDIAGEWSMGKMVGHSTTALVSAQRTESCFTGQFSRNCVELSVKYGLWT